MELTTGIQFLFFSRHMHTHVEKHAYGSPTISVWHHLETHNNPRSPIFGFFNNLARTTLPHSTIVLWHKLTEVVAKNKSFRPESCLGILNLYLDKAESPFLLLISFSFGPPSSPSKTLLPRLDVVQFSSPPLFVFRLSTKKGRTCAVRLRRTRRDA